MLHRTAVLEALFDAAERFDQPRCHPETRTELLDELYAWAIDPDSAHPIRWLHGPAGAGKSAVMQSLCQRFQDAGRLGGSFFFKRGHAACGNARALFATLAYQLALSRCEVKSPISSSVEMDPSVLGRGMDVQMRALILEPCRLLEGRIPSILLIDGLDECDGHHIQQQILRLIRPAIRWPLRILVASRPEPHIRETFEDTSFQGLLESTNIERSFHDVRQYLLQEFSRIHREHHNTMSGVPTPWPSADILEQLVEKSSGYFIYASTVIKYVGNEYSRPTKRLDIICNLAPQDSESPFATLDQLYFQILSEVPSHSRRVLCDILSVIVNAPGSGLDEPEIDELLGLESGDTDLILRPLHSVLSMSSGSMKMVRVHHASFADFLVNEERSAIFHIGSPEHHFKLAYSILKALAFSYEHGDASFHWVMINGVRSWISYVSGVAPSTDLVPLVERVNPEFILCFGARDGDEMKTFLRWLKKISPPPEHLIDRWEALAFIGLYERFENTVMLDVIGKHPLRSLIQPVSAPSPNMIHTLHARMNDPCKSMLQAFCALLSQSPTLVRVLQARRLLFLNRTDDDYDRNSLTFFAVRGLLDISWDDMLRSIWSLRPFVTGESRNFPLLFLLHPALCQLADGLCDEAIVARDIGCGFLRMLKRSHNGEVPTGNMVRRLSYIYGLFNFYRESPEDGSYYQWGQHIRSSPSADPEILQELHDFSPLLSVGLYRNSSSEDIHDVLQWLKVNYRHFNLLPIHDGFRNPLQANPT
ncbi:hypothetical protein DFH06DRAFT_1254839 [Mycena polygramma]|nr:hypothetical protein DFH06DRAFT_1254839 [Mycena polygramma]